MAHFIFSVAVVLLWLVAWGIYLFSGKSLKREMEEIENSDPNQNNPFITAVMGIGTAAISIFFPDTKPIVDGINPLAEKGLQEAFRKDKLTEGQKISISGLRFLSLFFIVVAAVIGLCLIWSFNGWSFWKVTGYFLLYVFVCFAPTLPNIVIGGILDDR
ncbi:hypothetical protein [Helicobacter pylori]|uniref:hypothetical protein n=1 Tax=Helicobacter pylori TaxID=210 RepID=UPI0002BA99E4|nr:hypothetical protein [Helicobacter pylori]MDO7821109.1 hypothetical protein [Helicobacter pylori]MDO7822119.1 hypothetical protein [Helicobacter pylori]OOC29014.1 hypothetical protein BZK23_00025 [Helicobacter pylori]